VKGNSGEKLKELINTRAVNFKFNLSLTQAILSRENNGTFNQWFAFSYYERRRIVAKQPLCPTIYKWIMHGLWFTYTKLLFIDNCDGRPYQYARISIGVRQSVFTNVRESQIVEQLVRALYQFSGLNTPVRPAKIES